MSFFGIGRNKQKGMSETMEKNISDIQIQLQQLAQLQQQQQVRGERTETAVEEMRQPFLEELQQINKRLRKQESIQEDLLEQLEEEQETFQKLEESLSGELQEQRYAGENELLHQSLRERETAYLAQEQKLLELIAAYDEYLRKTNEALAKVSEEGGRQNALVFQVLEQYMEAAGVKRIAGSGQPVDLETMTVLQVEKTDRLERENRVKETVIPGWICCGRVIQKAKVIVYRRSQMEQII